MIVGKQFPPSSNGMKTKVTENTYTYAQAQSNRATYAASIAGQKQGQKPVSGPLQQPMFIDKYQTS